MALGIFQFQSTIASQTDTVLIAAPSSNNGKPQAINLRWMTVDVTIAGTSSQVLVEDGAAGTVLFSVNSAAAGHHEFKFPTGRGSRGYKLTDNTALNVDTNTGSASGTIQIAGEYEVCGHN